MLFAIVLEENHFSDIEPEDRFERAGVGSKEHPITSSRQQ